MEGWIKLHRSLLNWEWYSDGDMVRVFLHLLLCASSIDTRWQGVAVKRGQVVVSQRKMSERLGMGYQTLRTCFQRLLKAEEIKITATHQFSLVTICDYDSYQGGEQEVQRTTNAATNAQLTQRPTQQLTQRPSVVNNNNSAACKVGKNKANAATNPLQQPQLTQQLTRFKNNIDNNKLSSLRSDNSSDKSDLDFDRFMEYFNSELEKANSVVPHLVSITPQRKNHIRARCREYGKKKLAEAVQKAAASGYLNGNNDRGWVATFAWFIRPNNFLKVLEGNYDNKTIEHGISKPQSEDRRRGTEVEAVSAEDYKTTF